MNSTATKKDRPVGKILLVEDDQDYARLLTRWLENYGGFEVATAGNGLMGTRMGETEEWDLIISDVNLPGVDGIELVRHCKARHPHTPVLLMTAHESVECAIRALQNRADDFLVKPFTRETLIAKAASLMTEGSFHEASERATVLAIGAHPEDIELGCGGVLLRHKNKGDSIYLLTLSHGTAEELACQRRQEAEAVARKISTELYWGNLYEQEISDGMETVAVIEKVIAQIKPTIIYTHTHNDANEDHRNTFFATMKAARRIKNLYCYQSHSTNINFQPNRFVDISSYITGKVHLLATYQSQVTNCEYLTPEFVQSNARYWGRLAGQSMVEPLEVIRECA